MTDEFKVRQCRAHRLGLGSEIRTPGTLNRKRAGAPGLGVYGEFPKIGGPSIVS